MGLLWTGSVGAEQQPAPAAPAADPYDTLREELAADPGEAIASGDVNGHPWTVRVFEDRSDSIDGTGANVYIDTGGPTYWLDRPDPDTVFDSIWYGEDAGSEVLVVVVANEAVARVELRSAGTGWEAERFAPASEAAFAQAFWVEARADAAPFTGEIVAYGQDGSVLQTRAFSTESERIPE